MSKKLLGLLLATLLTGSAYADEAGLRKAIAAVDPNFKADSIVKTPYGGLYEVFLDGQIIYTDEKFSFLISKGHLFETRSQRDITQKRLDELTKVDFSTFPLNQAIKVVKGNGSRKLVVFSDPDCPYCKQLEQKELIGISDVTIYTFLYPINQLHPDSANKSRAIWCAPDRAKAWEDWMLNGQLVKAGSCDTPIEKLAELGRKLGVTGTPTLFFTDGKRIPGAYPAKDIENALSEAFVAKK